MTKYSEYMKQRAAKDEEWFFGETHHTSNKYFTFKHYISDDEVIVITNNIKMVKGNWVLVVASNKAVYLKEWQIRSIRNYDMGIYGYAVKLNRKFFKPYTFRSNFEDIIIEEEETFDTMVQIAKEQDAVNMSIAQG